MCVCVGGVLVEKITPTFVYRILTGFVSLQQSYISISFPTNYNPCFSNFLQNCSCLVAGSFTNELIKLQHESSIYKYGKCFLTV